MSSKILCKSCAINKNLLMVLLYAHISKYGNIFLWTVDLSHLYGYGEEYYQKLGKDSLNLYIQTLQSQKQLGLKLQMYF